MGNGYASLCRDLSEGIAQYWTHAALKARPSWHDPFGIFLRLCKIQRLEYRMHTAWVPSPDLDGHGFEAYVRKPHDGVETLPPSLSIREGLRRIIIGPLRSNPGMSLGEFDKHVAEASANRLIEAVVRLF